MDEDKKMRRKRQTDGSDIKNSSPLLCTQKEIQYKNRRIKEVEQDDLETSNKGRR